MQVVLLAAGLGSRLGTLTKDLPKALIDVAGQPLLRHDLRFCALLAPTDIIVVGGFGFTLVERALAAARASLPGLPPTRLVENPDFRDGNLISFLTAREHLTSDFVLLNCDHIYRAAIAPLVAAPASRITAFIDTDRVLGADDMKVERAPEGAVRKIAKTLTRWDCGYVGMTRVPRSEAAVYLAACDAALADEGRAIHVERVLARLADAGHAPATRDISGHGWLEVDTPDERAHAEEVMAHGWT